MFPLLARGDLCILPAYRGQGTGTAGLRECLAATEKPVFLYVFMSSAGWQTERLIKGSEMPDIGPVWVTMYFVWDR